MTTLQQTEQDVFNYLNKKFRVGWSITEVTKFYNTLTHRQTLDESKDINDKLGTAIDLESEDYRKYSKTPPWSVRGFITQVYKSRVEIEERLTSPPVASSGSVGGYEDDDFDILMANVSNKRSPHTKIIPSASTGQPTMHILKKGDAFTVKTNRGHVVTETYDDINHWLTPATPYMDVLDYSTGVEQIHRIYTEESYKLVARPLGTNSDPVTLSKATPWQPTPDGSGIESDRMEARE